MSTSNSTRYLIHFHPKRNENTTRVHTNKFTNANKFISKYIKTMCHFVRGYDVFSRRYCLESIDSIVRESSNVYFENKPSSKFNFLFAASPILRLRVGRASNE